MTKASKNNVLILIPTLGKREDYLRETVESIKNQTYQNFDIAFIYPLENNSVSTLAEELGAMKIADPGGISAALNVGVAATKPNHAFISWIGDDDLLATCSLEITVKALTENPHSPVAYGYCDYIDAKGNFLFKSNAGSIAPWLMTWGPNLLPLPGALFRTESIIQVGGFDESNKHTMDLDIFLRLKKLGKFINTHHTLASFRWHSDSISVGSRDKSIREAEGVKRKHTHPLLRPLTPLWFAPTRLASKLAAKKLSK